jgi:hypothetical protein
MLIINLLFNYRRHYSLLLYIYIIIINIKVLIFMGVLLLLLLRCLYLINLFYNAFHTIYIFLTIYFLLEMFILLLIIINLTHDSIIHQGYIHIFNYK